MAEYKSQYEKLGFYVNGEFHRFQDGRFITNDESIIKVLSNITDAECVCEPKAEEAPKEKPKAPATKPPKK
jgi:hypothetical protein